MHDGTAPRASVAIVMHAPAACAPLLLSHRPPWLRARSYAVYAVLTFQILAWGYITQNPTPRLQRKAWLDMVIYGCYVSLPHAAGLACLGSTATPRLRVHARGPATGQAMGPQSTCVAHGRLFPVLAIC